MAFDAKQALREIAHGDNDALNFMLALYRWVHALDDLFDRDRPVAMEVTHAAHWGFVEALTYNLFYKEHAAELLPVLRLAMLGHIESERFQKSPNVLDRITSQVLKSHYHEVFFYVAFLTGGHEHMLAMSRAYRLYDFDSPPAA